MLMRRSVPSLASRRPRLAAAARHRSAGAFFSRSFERGGSSSTFATSACVTSPPFSSKLLASCPPSPSSFVHHHRPQMMRARTFAVKINVGHGPAYTESQAPRFAVADDTTGNMHDDNSSSSSDNTTATTSTSGRNERINRGIHKVRATPEQQKAARLESDRMVRSTASLLDGIDNGSNSGSSSSSSSSGTNSSSSSAAPTADSKAHSAAQSAKLRVLLHYWTTRWYAHHHPALTFTPTVSVSDETGAMNAERILDHVIDAGKGGLVEEVVGVDGNAALVNLMDAYLLPCTLAGGGDDGAAASNEDGAPAAQGGDGGGVQFFAASTKSINAASWSKSILNALRVHAKMRRLFDNGYDGAVPSNSGSSSGSSLKADTLSVNGAESSNGSSSLKADTLSVNATLGILSKICAVLSSGRVDDATKKELEDALIESSLMPPSCGAANLSVEYVITLMEQTLLDAERRYYQEDDASIMPDVYTYNTVIGSLARYDATDDAVERIERYLRRMELAEDGDGDGNDAKTTKASTGRYPATCPPDVVTYNSILYVHSTLAASPLQGEKGGAVASAVAHTRRAAALLQRMEERYARTQRPEVQPDTISYATVLHSHANVGNAKEAERILDHMARLGQTEGWSGRVRPNTICFNSTLHALSKSGEADSAHRAESLLQRMESLAESNPELGIRPDTISYCAAIGAWARSDADDGAERAEALLERTLARYRGGDARVKPDIISYNSVLDAYAKQSARSRGRAALAAAERADALVGQMERGEGEVRPCTISYNILIDAWSKCGWEGSEEKAEAILRRMPEPDEISWNNVLHSYADNGKEEGLVAALRLLREMEESDSAPPSTISYNLVMDAITRRGTTESAEKAEKILHKMEELFEAGDETVKPSAVSYNIVINGWSKSGSADAGEKAQALLERMAKQSKKWGSNEISPDTVSYTSVIDSFAKSGKKNAADQAEKLLYTMREEGGIAPNRVTFNTVMNAVAKSGAPGSAERAEAILKQMEELYQAGNADVSPDDISYSTVLNALARSGEDDAAERAEAILLKLEALSEDGTGNVKPNAYAYSSVITAWARSKDAKGPIRALSLLNRMQSMYESGNLQARPNSFCYNGVINAFAKSRYDDKAKQSEQILKRMLHDYHSGNNRDAKPSEMTYSTILNACAYTSGSSEHKQEAFRIARSCFKEVLSLKSPNCVAFAMFLLACARLTPRGAERDVLVESVFQECCRRGQVDGLVIRNLRSAASPKLLTRLLGKSSTHAQLPSEWSSNIVQKKGRRAAKN